MPKFEPDTLDYTWTVDAESVTPEITVEVADEVSVTVDGEQVKSGTPWPLVLRNIGTERQLEIHLTHETGRETYAIQLALSAPTWANEGAGIDEYGAWVSLLIRGLPIKFRYIPAGSFVMGSPEDEAGRDADEGPLHTVTLTKGFWLANTECTQALWEAVIGSWKFGFSDPLAPAELLSWEDTQDFFTDLESRYGLAGRLPTEAEWEYAARANETDGPLYRPLDEIGWCLSNSATDLAPDGTTHAVAGKAPNAWGLYDMIGNVFEWTQDRYDAYSSEDVENPRGRLGANYVLRGGSWLSTGSCRIAARYGDIPPDDRSNGTTGLRIAVSR